MEKFGSGIRNTGWKKDGSGINIPDPQHWSKKDPQQCILSNSPAPLPTSPSYNFFQLILLYIILHTSHVDNDKWEFFL
jgi:hypothetical protein